MKSNSVKNEKSHLKKPEGMLFALLLFSLWIGQCFAIVDLPKVPLLDNISIAEADYLLANSNLTANKSYCFSNSIPEHFVIPKTQNPAYGTIWYADGEVTLKVSRGKFPSVIGMSQPDAERTISDLNLIPKVITDRNETVPQGFVFNQEPKKVGCLAPEIVTIFVSAPLSVDGITLNPYRVRDSGDEYRIITTETSILTGHISSRLKENEHLWIAVKPILSNNWWPQTSPGDITLYGDGMFQGSVYLGGNDSDLFEIGILLLNNETNERFLQWDSDSKNATNWGPITDPNYRSYLTNAEINSLKLTSLEVELQKKSSQIWKEKIGYALVNGTKLVVGDLARKG